MRFRALIVLFLTLASYAIAQPALPRQSPEFAIKFHGGQETLLSAYRGKVVIVEFLLTWCSHCQQTAMMINKLYEELGPQGLQAVGIGFNQGADLLVAPFIQQLGISFPVGYTDQDHVISFTGASPNDRLMAPQIVVIDRKRMIRAQSGPQGAPVLQDEAYLRKLVEGLLKEGAHTTTSTRHTTSTK